MTSVSFKKKDHAQKRGSLFSQQLIFDIFQFVFMFFCNRGIGHLKAFQLKIDNAAQAQPCKPFIIRRQDIPGCIVGRSIAQHFFIRLGVLVPVTSFFHIRLRKLPVLRFIIYPV